MLATQKYGNLLGDGAKGTNAQCGTFSPLKDRRCPVGMLPDIVTAEHLAWIGMVLTGYNL